MDIAFWLADSSDWPLRLPGEKRVTDAGQPTAGWRNGTKEP